jgi:hypothetical protein
MVSGVVIAESLREDAVIDGLELLVRTVTRWRNPAPAPGQADVWTILKFDSPTDPDVLAGKMAAAVAPGPWYVDFRSAEHVWVIYAEKQFRYGHGDDAGRAEAIAYGRAVGVPSDQLDWSD